MKKKKKEKQLDLTFTNSEEAFRSKTFGELLRGYLVFIMCSSKPLVTHSEKLMRISEKVLGNKLFSLLMRMTVFGHFVGGEDEQELTPKLTILRKYGVKSILDYAAEEDIGKDEKKEKLVTAATPSARVPEAEVEELGGKLEQYKPEVINPEKVVSARTFIYEDEETCERNTEYFIESIEAIAAQGEGLVAVKLTALGKPQFLLQLSEVIVRARAFVKHITGEGGSVISHHLTVDDLVKKLEKMDIPDIDTFLKNVVRDNEGLIHLFPWFGIVNEEIEVDESFKIPSLRQKKMVTLMSKLSDQEKQMFRNTLTRLKRIICAAKEMKVNIAIDAEQTYFQPAISRITMELAHIYNKEAPIIINTYQAYLKQTFDEVKSDIEEAKRQKFYYGFKLVRGAYLEQERERAKQLKYEDPTNPSYNKTTEMYNKTLEYVLKEISINKQNGEPNKLILMIASHNEGTVRHVLEQMECNDVTKEDNVIAFGQLLGMCDNITFTLGQAGYSAYKYVPYGPMHKVVPYLVRRAQENIGVLARLNKEKQILRTEILRRILKGKIFYKP